jgi:PTS system N-acetylgalactosamine-specific IIB component
VRIDSLGRTDFEALQEDAVPTLLVFRDISDVALAREKGLRLSQVNVGNVHAREGRTAVSSSVYLSADEKARLKAWEAEGIVVELRAVPNEAPLLPSSFLKEA